MPPIASIFIAAATPTVDLPDPNSYQAIGWVAVVLAAIMVGIYYAVSLWQMLFPRRNPTLEAEFASKADLERICSEIRSEHAREIAAIRTANDAGAALGVASRKEIYARLGDLEKMGSSMTTSIEDLKAQGHITQEQIMKLVEKVTTALARSEK